MRAIKVKVGDVFGRLTVTAQAESRNGKTRWVCRCECGGETTVQSTNLTRPKNPQISCGCYNRERTSEAKTTHGHSGAKGRKKSRTYNIWAEMKRRCIDSTRDNYYLYGGRGISYDPRWEDFTAFLSDMGEAPDEHSIDRADVNGNYNKDNCRWATNVEQGRNRRNNTILTYNGKSQCIAAWADELGISQKIISSRRNKLGWSIERALSTPVRALSTPVS